MLQCPFTCNCSFCTDGLGLVGSGMDAELGQEHELACVSATAWSTPIPP